MRVDFKVSYYLRTNYLNKKGEAAIMVRLNLNSERLTVGASGFSVRPDLWDNLRMCVKGKTAEARNLNLELDEINMRLRTIAFDLKDDELSLDKIKTIYENKGTDVKTVLEYYEKFINEIKEQIGFSKKTPTLQKHMVAMKHFKNFLWTKMFRKDIRPKELTPMLINDFEIYLRVKAGLKENTAAFNMKMLKSVVIHGRKTGFFTHDPFMNPL